MPIDIVYHTRVSKETLGRGNWTERAEELLSDATDSKAPTANITVLRVQVARVEVQIVRITTSTGRRPIVPVVLLIAWAGSCILVFAPIIVPTKKVTRLYQRRGIY